MTRSSPPPDDSFDPETPRRVSPMRRAMKLASTLMVLSLFAWVIRSIIHDAAQLDWANLVRSPLALVGALASWSLAFSFRAWLWGEMMRRSGYSIGHFDGARVFFVSHMGRFLPGKVWSVAGAGVFGKRYGLPARESAVSMMVFLIIYYMVGSLFTLLVVWQLSSTHFLVSVAFALGGLSLLAFLATPLFPKLLQMLGRHLRRDMSGLRLPSAGMLVVLTLGLAVVWATAGTAYVLLTRAVVPAEVGQLELVAGWGIYATALVAGFAALFAPAGLGVREAVMLAFLEPAFGAGFGGVVTLAARVVITSLELTFSAWGAFPALVDRHKR